MVSSAISRKATTGLLSLSLSTVSGDPDAMSRARWAASSKASTVRSRSAGGTPGVTTRWGTAGSPGRVSAVDSGGRGRASGPASGGVGRGPPIRLSTAIPFLQSLNLKAPVHYDEANGEYAIDFPFPCEFDPDEKRWLFAEGQIEWLDDGSGKRSVMKRWRGRGPMNDEFVEVLQRGHRQVSSMLTRETH